MHFLLCSDTYIQILLSYFTFYLIRQYIIFFLQFQQSAHAISDAVEYHSQVIQQALLSKSQALTTFAAFAGATWPYVSLPDFQPQCQNFIAETKTNMVAWAPIIKSSQTLRAWEAYSTYMLEYSGWFPTINTDEESPKMPSKQPELNDNTNRQQAAPVLDIGLSIPLWQISPWLYSDWIKQNLTEQFEVPISHLLETRQPTWTQFVDLQQQQQQQQQDNQTNRLSKLSFVLQPVFRALPSMNVRYDKANKTEEELLVEQKEIVALYIAAIEWEQFLADLLPEGISNVHVVLRNGYGESFTLEINESQGYFQAVSLVESKDKYEDMAIHTELILGNEGQETIYLNGTRRSLVKSNNDTSGSYTSLSTYYVSIYPTKAFEDSVKSNDPIWITVIMAAVFFVGIVSFHLYARLVHNRQQKLVQTANRTALVIKSLFPSNVRDR